MNKGSKGFRSLVNNFRGENVTRSSHHITSLFPNATDVDDFINVLFGQFFVSSDSFPKFSVVRRENIVLCNERFVHNLLSSIKAGKAIGCDRIPPVLLKRTVAKCRPLCRIFNLSFRHACIPQTWKIADVCPSSYFFVRELSASCTRRMPVPVRTAI